MLFDFFICANIILKIQITKNYFSLVGQQHYLLLVFNDPIVQID